MINIMYGLDFLEDFVVFDFLINLIIIGNGVILMSNVGDRKG